MVEHGTDLTHNGTHADDCEGMCTGPAGDGRRPKTPALEEVLEVLPEWAMVSKYVEG